MRSLPDMLFIVDTNVEELAVSEANKVHVPIIGMNAALPVLEQASVTDRYDATMRISLAVIDACVTLLLIGESPGAKKERDLILAQGEPVFTRIEDVPLP